MQYNLSACFYHNLEKGKRETIKQDRKITKNKHIGVGKKEKGEKSDFLLKKQILQ